MYDHGAGARNRTTGGARPVPAVCLSFPGRTPPHARPRHAVGERAGGVSGRIGFGLGTVGVPVIFGVGRKRFPEAVAGLEEFRAEFPSELFQGAGQTGGAAPDVRR